MNIHIINLLSIIDVKYKIEVFSKADPDKILLYIPFNEYNLLKSGWQKYNKRIYYNGNTYWLHPKYVKVLKINTKDLDTIGLRVSNDNQKKYTIDPTVFKSIPRDEKITIILEESNEFSIKNYIIDDIKNVLTKKGYKIFNFKTVQEEFEKSYATTKIILEYLTGHKINNNKFIETKVTQFSVVKYYDNDTDNLDYMYNADEMLKEFYDNSDKKLQKELYSDLRYSDSNYYLELYQIVPNKYNIVKKDVIKLGILNKLSYLESFSTFKS